MTVLSHADGSFTADSNLDQLTLDFGDVALDGDVVALDFELHNLESPAGFTSALDFDALAAGGDTEVFATTLEAFSGLVSGDSRPFSATFAPTVEGQFSATYVLQLSDIDVPGSASQFLALLLTGTATLELLADFDRDRDVDGEDFLAWQSGFGITTGAIRGNGDADGDGDVDGEDFLTWQAEFTVGAGRGSGVPEPAAVAMLALLVVVAAGTRSRHAI